MDVILRRRWETDQIQNGGTPPSPVDSSTGQELEVLSTSEASTGGGSPEGSLSLVVYRRPTGGVLLEESSTPIRGRPRPDLLFTTHSDVWLAEVFYSDRSKLLCVPTPVHGPRRFDLEKPMTFDTLVRQGYSTPVREAPLWHSSETSP